VSAPEPLIILGTGRGAVELLDLVADVNAASDRPRFACLGFLDDDPARQGTQFEGLPVHGPLRAAAGLGSARFLNAISSLATYWRRDEIIAATGLAPERFATLIHPSAHVSRRAEIGRGVVLFPHVTITVHARVDDGVLILANSVVNHDVAIGAHACLASSVALAGGVRVGRCCYLGQSCSIIAGVEIGERSLVGMGSVVRHDVEPRSVVVGNPARLLRRLDAP
jgi:sugar O-acyltransferase (sialic acid O-acetyltransferase NeuD family)